MQVEQYVMAYGIEQDRIRAIIPEGFVSLRPVLRINAEIQDNSNGYLEFNTPVEKDNAGCYFLKETPELKKRRRSPRIKNSVTAHFSGSLLKRMPMVSASENPFQPIHKSRKRPIPEIHLQQKMQQKFHADRCWEHIKLFLKDSKVKITKKQS